MLTAISSSRKRPVRTAEGHVLAKANPYIHEIRPETKHLDHLRSLRALFLGPFVDFLEQSCGFVFFNDPLSRPCALLKFPYRVVAIRKNTISFLWCSTLHHIHGQATK